MSALAPNQLARPPIPGSKGWYYPAQTTHYRGTFVFFEGLTSFVTPNYQPPAIGPNYDSGGAGIFPSYLGTMFQILAADGWNVMSLSSAQDYATLSPGASAMEADIASDPGHGRRYRDTMAKEVLQAASWVNANHPGPIILSGGSGGGYTSLVGASVPEIASKFVAICPIVPATIWECLWPAFATALGVTGFASTDCKGADISPTDLNGLTVPTLITYGLRDNVVGWGGNTTIGAGQTPVAASTLVGSTTLALTSTTGFNSGALARIWTTEGPVYLSFSGTTGGLQGCTFLAGAATGVIGPGAVVEQSYTDLLITTAQAAGAPVTRNATNNEHSFDQETCGTYYNGATVPLTNFSGGATLAYENAPPAWTGPPFTTQQASGKTAIFASDGQWHTMTFSAPTSTGFPNCAIATPGAATITNGSPICSIHQSGTDPQSIPFWISQNIDINCPQVH